MGMEKGTFRVGGNAPRVLVPPLPQKYAGLTPGVHSLAEPYKLVGRAPSSNELNKQQNYPALATTKWPSEQTAFKGPELTAAGC